MQELVSFLQNHERLTQSIDTQKYEICYRGLGENWWDNSPTIFRNNNLRLEKNYIEEVVRHFPNDFSEARTVDILTQIQHYDGETRMMDVTFNPLVALFFACGGWQQIYDNKGYNSLLSKHGCVRVYKVPKENIKSINSETVTVLSNIARLKDGDDFGQLPWLCERDWGVWQSDDDQIVQNAKDANDVFLVKTKLNNPRVMAQSGGFFLFGGLSGIEGITDPKFLRKAKIKKTAIKLPSHYIVGDLPISASDKSALLKNLAQVNISFNTLCPEKADFIRSYLKTIKNR